MRQPYSNSGVLGRYHASLRTITISFMIRFTTAVDTNNKQQSTKSGSGRLGGGGGGGSDTRITAASTADGTMALIAATTTTAAAVATVAATAAEEGSGGGGAGSAGMDVSGVVRWWSQENRKAIWRFHPTARRHVFDAVCPETRMAIRAMPWRQHGGFYF